jgi:L-ascorbate metabolism protein UlaG (beta-lactamase superfamily)
VKLADLPRIDCILISHDHYDHLDIRTLEDLARLHKPVILTGLGVGRRLAGLGHENVVELDWWQEYAISPSVCITFVPARHTSGRTPLDKNETLWGGFVIQDPSGNILFFGDTARGAFLEQIHKRWDRFRLALLPVGSYEKRWFMQSQHMNPDDAVLLHALLGVEQSVGIHFATFNEHPEQAVDAHEKDLKAALEQHHMPQGAFRLLKFGEAMDLGE